MRCHALPWVLWVRHPILPHHRPRRRRWPRTLRLNTDGLGLQFVVQSADDAWMTLLLFTRHAAPKALIVDHNTRMPPPRRSTRPSTSHRRPRMPQNRTGTSTTTDPRIGVRSRARRTRPRAILERPSTSRLPTSAMSVWGRRPGPPHMRTNAHASRSRQQRAGIRRHTHGQTPKIYSWRTWRFQRINGEFQGVQLRIWALPDSDNTGMDRHKAHETEKFARAAPS